MSAAVPAAGTVVFSGPTLEGALAAARTAYGPRVRIVRAQRVRRGVRGLLGQVRYDVHARLPGARPAAPAPDDRGPTWPGTDRPRPRPAPGGDGLADALRDLVDAADSSERSVAEPSWSWNGEAEVGALLADVATLRTARAERPSGHPALDLAAHAAHAAHAAPAAAPAAPAAPGAPLWRDLLADAVQPPARPEPPRPAEPVGPARPAPAGPALFDRNDLRGIGVPAAVLRRLPVEDPVDDGGWRRALQEAIEAVVPAPADPDDDHPVVVSGHGLAGVVAVLRAAVEDGAAPGTISHRGRRRQATPAALVEVLASCARS